MRKSSDQSSDDSSDEERKPVPVLDAIPGFDSWLEVQDLADEVISLDKQIAVLVERKKEKTLLINAYMSTFKDDASWSGKLPNGHGTVCYIKPKDRNTLVKELLIQKGVTLDTIKACTRSTPVTPFVTVVPAGKTKADVPMMEE